MEKKSGIDRDRSRKIIEYNRTGSPPEYSRFYAKTKRVCWVRDGRLLLAEHSMVHLHFTFAHPAVTSPPAANVFGILKEHPSAFMLERASEPRLQDSLLHLSVLPMNKDIFSRQYSIIYKKSKSVKIFE